MAKAIRSYPEGKRVEVIARRIKGKTGGLGYLAALDAEKRIDARRKSERKVALAQAVAQAETVAQ